MKFHKILVILMLSFFTVYSVSYAAIGGSKRVSTPKITQKAPQKAETPKDGYKSSAPANSYSDKAPNSTGKANTAVNGAAAQQSSSPFGGFMRSFGMFAGGMMLGSLLGGMFGMGGFMTEIMGLIVNVLIFGAVILLLKMLWDKFSGRKNKRNESYYRR